MSRPARARRRRPPRKQRRQSFGPGGMAAAELPHAVRPTASGLPVGPLRGIFMSRRPMYQSGAAVYNERRRGAFNSPADRHTRRWWNELDIGLWRREVNRRDPHGRPPWRPGLPSIVSAPPWPSVRASGAAVTGAPPAVCGCKLDADSAWAAHLPRS